MKKKGFVTIIGVSVMVGLSAAGIVGAEPQPPASYSSKTIQIDADYASGSPRVSYYPTVNIAEENSDKREVGNMFIVDAGTRQPQAIFLNQNDQQNAAVQAMRVLQEAMQGEAERTGLITEEDVISLIKELRNS